MGATPLHVATEQGSLPVVALLLKYVPSVDTRDQVRVARVCRDGYSTPDKPLEAAAERRRGASLNSTSEPEPPFDVIFYSYLVLYLSVFTFRL